MEKFALLDFLKVFEALSSSGDKKKEETPPANPEKATPPPPPENSLNDFNAMANVLSRHEEIANRVKNNRR